MQFEQYLVKNGLCGPVATPPSSVFGNILKMLTGDLDYTFGLEYHGSADVAEAIAALNEFTGEDVAKWDLANGTAHIDARRTVSDLRRQRRVLWETTTEPGAQILLATGHPTGLLEHYGDVARWCRSRGAHVMIELEDQGNGSTPPSGKGLRYVDGVACVSDGGNLLHSHRADLMEALLEHLMTKGMTPDLVIADHGLAGAAIAQGLPTIAIADVNDPALLLANYRGDCDTVVMFDDNLPPKRYKPMTQFLIEVAES